MNKKIYMLIPILSFTSLAWAQVHSHGEGQLLISQDDKQWLVQFVIPAVDIFGFEHAPETPEQIKQLANQTQKLKTNDGVIDLGQQCLLHKTDIEYDHHHQQEHDHQNIEFSYHFTCTSTVNEVSVLLFEWVNSLEHLEVQWFTEDGQGADELNSSKSFIAW
jgi:hypothetical protein